MGLGLGLAAIYAANLVDRYRKAGVDTVRFATSRWNYVARAAGVGRPGD